MPRRRCQRRHCTKVPSVITPNTSASPVDSRDWQIAQWLLPRVRARMPGVANPLPAVPRRSSQSPASLVPPDLCCCWELDVPPDSGPLPLLVLAIHYLPAGVGLVDLFRKPQKCRWFAHCGAGRLGRTQLGQALLPCVPPYDAFISPHPRRTRAVVSHKRSLERSNCHVRTHARSSLAGSCDMWIDRCRSARVFPGLTQPAELLWPRRFLSCGLSGSLAH